MKILDKILPEEKGNRKTFYKILGVLVIGIMLLLTSNTFMTSSKKIISNDNDPVPETSSKTKGTSEFQEEIPFELEMEKRLAGILKKMQGVGEVDVMITTTYGKEIILAEDVTSHASASLEQDKEGGIREVNSHDDQKKIVMQNPASTGGNQPVVIKEKQPEIQGVLVIAEGANHSLVKQSIINATQTLLGIPSHKVTVHTLQN